MPSCGVCTLRTWRRTRCVKGFVQGKEEEEEDGWEEEEDGWEGRRQYAQLS